MQQAVPKMKASTDFTNASRLQMQRSAQYIEDDDLKAALNSLSETLAKHKGSP
jgi:Tfp pilus assembly protein PilF